MTEFDLLELALFARGGGKPNPMVGAVFGGIALLVGLLVVAGSMRRPRNAPASHGADGGRQKGGLVVGIVLCAFGYGLLAVNLALPGGDVALQIAGWTTALGGLFVPGLLWRFLCVGPAVDSSDGPFAATPEERLAPWLQADERVLWTGAPDVRHFRREAAGLALAGLVPFGFGAMFASIVAYRLQLDGVPWGTLSGVVLVLELSAVFMCLGAALMLCPWALRSRLKDVVYAVTDRRGLVLTRPCGALDPIPLRKKHATAAAGAPMEFSPSEMLFPEELKRGGKGVDLIFASETTGSGKERRVTFYGFLGLSDPDEARNVIEQAFRRPAPHSVA